MKIDGLWLTEYCFSKVSLALPSMHSIFFCILKCISQDDFRNKMLIGFTRKFGINNCSTDIPTLLGYYSDNNSKRTVLDILGKNIKDYSKYMDDENSAGDTSRKSS